MGIGPIGSGDGLLGTASVYRAPIVILRSGPENLTCGFDVDRPFRQGKSPRHCRCPMGENRRSRRALSGTGIAEIVIGGIKAARWDFDFPAAGTRSD
jgi:hypothetical protein